MGSPTRNQMNGFRYTIVRLVPAAATARTRHWCSDKPVEKRGSEVTYRSVVTSASVAIPFRSLLVS